MYRVVSLRAQGAAVELSYKGLHAVKRLVGMGGSSYSEDVTPDMMLQKDLGFIDYKYVKVMPGEEDLEQEDIPTKEIPVPKSLAPRSRGKKSKHYSEEDLKSMTVKQLKDLIKEYDLDVSHRLRKKEKIIEGMLEYNIPKE